MPKTRSQRKPALKVVDIFAGPGGLGEGFAAFERQGTRPFEVRLSVEKDPTACATLELRKLFRQFDSPPAEFAAYYSGGLSRAALFDAFPAQARKAKEATWQAELGKVSRRLVSTRVRKALGPAPEWVLLGGPPCQAYSVAGRSRMRGQAGFEKDERHFLYREYLQIVADHEPALFVLENVKGLLTSTHGGSRIVTRILDDLSGPAEAVGGARRGGKRYRLYALCQRQVVLPWVNGSVDGSEFLLQAEEYGIPQTRHRLFIVGVRSDIPGNLGALKPRPEVSTAAVLSDLPSIRSTLSREDDNLDAWRAAIAMIGKQRWLRTSARTGLRPVVDQIERVLDEQASGSFTTGAAFTDHSGGPSALRDWYREGASGIAQHESRAHMKEDLHRYLFCACFAKVHGRSPRLGDFPEELQPSHRNVSRALETQLFADRFRVQLPNRPSTTITSHVSKDGHYYIHYDPVQCRSLTVREAARLQTFPDSYFFEGNRTQQYHQIGNAVPPLLAREIAQVVFELLSTGR